MALRIFDADPDAKPKPRKTEFTKTEYAYQFRSGMQVKNARGKMEPASLANWRVLTDNQDTASAIAELMGGTPDEFDPTKELNLQVLTESPSVEIVINGSKAIEDKLILWGPRGTPIHECDGMTNLSPADIKGTPCGCPSLMSERKDLAKQGRGPSPSIGVTFRLAGLGYELGYGKMTATAWTFAMVVHEVKEALDQVDGEALCRLELEHVKFTNKAGIPVEYRKPVITVLGSYNDAIAEER